MPVGKTDFTSDEPKQIELIKKIAQKTIAGKIKWHKEGRILSTSIRTNLTAEFELEDFEDCAETWRQFSVKAGQGLLLAVTPPPTLVAPTSEEDLAWQAGKLYRLVKEGGIGVDQALEIVGGL
jgi:hypothetical protein